MLCTWGLFTMLSFHNYFASFHKYSEGVSDNLQIRYRGS